MLRFSHFRFVFLENVGQMQSGNNFSFPFAPSHSLRIFIVVLHVQSRRTLSAWRKSEFLLWWKSRCHQTLWFSRLPVMLLCCVVQHEWKMMVLTIYTFHESDARAEECANCNDIMSSAWMDQWHYGRIIYDEFYKLHLHQKSIASNAVKFKVSCAEHFLIQLTSAVVRAFSSLKRELSLFRSCSLVGFLFRKEALHRKSSSIKTEW